MTEKNWGMRTRAASLARPYELDEKYEITLIPNNQRLVGKVIDAYEHESVR